MPTDTKVQTPTQVFLEWLKCQSPDGTVHPTSDNIIQLMGHAHGLSAQLTARTAELEEARKRIGELTEQFEAARDSYAEADERAFHLGRDYKALREFFDANPNSWGARFEKLEATLKGVIQDLHATYEATKQGKPLEISIGQFRRLDSARAAIKDAP